MKSPQSRQVNVWYPTVEDANLIRAHIKHVKQIILKKVAVKGFDCSIRDGEAIRVALEYFCERLEEEAK